MLELPSFDELKDLAEKDPKQLEALRQQWIEATINSAPEPCQQRLKGLQFEIDARRRTAANPMSACITLSRMMHERLADLRQCLIDNQQQLSDVAQTLNNQRAALQTSPQQTSAQQAGAQAQDNANRQRPVLQAVKTGLRASHAERKQQAHHQPAQPEAVPADSATVLNFPLSSNNSPNH